MQTSCGIGWRMLRVFNRLFLVQYSKFYLLAKIVAKSQMGKTSNLLLNLSKFY